MAALCVMRRTEAIECTFCRKLTSTSVPSESEQLQSPVLLSIFPAPSRKKVNRKQRLVFCADSNNTIRKCRKILQTPMRNSTPTVGQRPFSLTYKKISFSNGFLLSAWAEGFHVLLISQTRSSKGKHLDLFKRVILPVEKCCMQKHNSVVKLWQNKLWLIRIRFCLVNTFSWKSHKLKCNLDQTKAKKEKPEFNL